VPDIPVKALIKNGHMLSSAIADFILLSEYCPKKLFHCFLDVNRSSIMKLLYGVYIK
jgi:hypothetical protein